MSLDAEIKKIRRMLRDPDGRIWSDNFLMHLYNDIQRDVQNKTMVLENATTQRVPAIYQWSYQFDWEYAFLPEGQSQFYQCLKPHDGNTVCYRWETQC